MTRYSEVAAVAAAIAVLSTVATIFQTDAAMIGGNFALGLYVANLYLWVTDPETPISL